MLAGNPSTTTVPIFTVLASFNGKATSTALAVAEGAELLDVLVLFPQPASASDTDITTVNMDKVFFI
ncbi:hypothetical protein D3C85_1876020 [compost metagenome]